MQNNSYAVSQSEAQEAIQSVEETSKYAISLFKLPLWINLIFSLLVGVQIVGGVMDLSDGPLPGWADPARLSASAVCIIFAISWPLWLRKKGVKQVFSSDEKIAAFILIALVFVIVSVGVYFYNRDFSWAPYVAGIVAFSSCFYFFLRRRL